MMKHDPETRWPTSCERRSDIDRNKLFVALYDRWVAAGKGRNGTAICELLETRKQIVSGYRTGHGGRIPPWWVLNRLLRELAMEVRITPDGVVLTNRRGKTDAGPGTRSADLVLAYVFPHD